MRGPSPRRVIFGVVALVLLAGGARSVLAQQVGRTPLEVVVPSAPMAAVSLGRQHLVYEVHITNFGSSTVTLSQMDILSGATALDSWSGPRLAQRLAVLGAAGASATAAGALSPGARTIVYVFLSLPPGATAPRIIQHRLVVSGADARRDTLITGEVAVRIDSLPALAAPVRGGPWVAIRAPSNTSGHRLSFVATNGRVGVPQRFAVDWAMLGPDGKLFHGDSAVASNWYGYGQPAYSVAAGTVVLARDGSPDNKPFGAAPPGVVDPLEATGNVLVVDLGEGRFATYAHLKPGSLRVHLGARVTEGQQLAEIGNSGNTLGPHLHFHVNTSAQPLGGEGLPYVLRDYELVGRIASMPSLLSGTAWMASPAQPARPVRRELPFENMVVIFAVSAVAVPPR